jgi:hypothetical protein
VDAVGDSQERVEEFRTVRKECETDTYHICDRAATAGGADDAVADDDMALLAAGSKQVICLWSDIWLEKQTGDASGCAVLVSVVDLEGCVVSHELGSSGKRKVKRCYTDEHGNYIEEAVGILFENETDVAALQCGGPTPKVKMAKNATEKPLSKKQQQQFLAGKKDEFFSAHEDSQHCPPPPLPPPRMGAQVEALARAAR